jgi:ferritin-like metal-binding protein YciE
MEASNIKDLYVAALKKMHEGEKQIAQALPTMADSATDDDLKKAFQSHLQETKTHQQRLEDILQDLGESSPESDNEVVKALIEQGESVVQSNADEDVRDAALIAAAQQVEHFEIASYGVLATYADTLDRSGDLEQLKNTLNEEKSADDDLNHIAKRLVNPKAQSA